MGLYEILIWPKTIIHSHGIKGLNILFTPTVLCVFCFVSDSNKCDSENNNNVENVSSVRKNLLVSTKQEETDNNYHMNSDASEEYHVTLEKIWGTTGLKIEVCINQRKVTPLTVLFVQ
jgi:hypothetical protein